MQPAIYSTLSQAMHRHAQAGPAKRSPTRIIERVAISSDVIKCSRMFHL